MAGTVEAEPSSSPIGNLMSISHDQLVMGDKQSVKEDSARSEGEPAAISAAKMAAKDL